MQKDQSRQGARTSSIIGVGVMSEVGVGANGCRGYEEAMMQEWKKKEEENDEKDGKKANEGNSWLCNMNGSEVEG